MGALKLQTLKQKFWVIIAASFIARVVVFFTLPNTPSSLGPDEGTYSSITKWIGESKPADEFPAYGEGLYLSGRAIIIPASFLFRAGFNELDAVRLISTLYGFLTLILVASFVLKLYKEDTSGLLDNKLNKRIIIGLMVVYAFLPSHFMWSNLGLRESTTEFWLISTFMVFLIIFEFRKKITFPTLLILFGSIVLTFSARPQVGWVLGVSLLLFLFLNLKNPNSYFLIPLVLCSVLFGSVWNLGSTANVVATGVTGTSGSILGNAFKPLSTAGEVVSYKQEVNQLDAVSVIETQSCPRETTDSTAEPITKFDTYFCIAWRAPYMVSTFLLRPIIGVDVTSTSSLIAAFENIFWLVLLIVIFTLAIKRRTVLFFAPILPALIFLALYVLGASAYQGNMGTGFRHKSLVLWVLLLLTFALAGRKPKDISTKPRSNSQESAV